jgi:hypothetical protein
MDYQNALLKNNQTIGIAHDGADLKNKLMGVMDFFNLWRK